MQFDPLDLDFLRQQGLLRIVRHPDHPVDLLEYERAAYTQGILQGHPVLEHCRGTIVERSTGRVIAKPFRKFYNRFERDDLDDVILDGYGAPDVTHKADGSMLTLWHLPYRAGLHFSSTGGFSSLPQRQAERYWREIHVDAETRLDPALTYVFEWVSPHNRIVVQYPDERLILIGVINTETGYEYDYSVIRDEAERLDLVAVPLETGDWRELCATAHSNFEGFVLHWPRPQLRLKMKQADYLEGHRIVTGISPRRMWEAYTGFRDLSAERPGKFAFGPFGGSTALEQMRTTLPEEMWLWFDDEAARLENGVRDAHAQVSDALTTICHLFGDYEAENRVQARAVSDYVNAHSTDPVRGWVLAAYKGHDWQGTTRRSGLFMSLQPNAETLFQLRGRGKVQ